MYAFVEEFRPLNTFTARSAEYGPVFLSADGKNWN